MLIGMKKMRSRRVMGSCFECVRVPLWGVSGFCPVAEILHLRVMSICRYVMNEQPLIEPLSLVDVDESESPI